MKHNKRIPEKLPLKVEVVRYLKPVDHARFHQVDGALLAEPLHTGPDCSKFAPCTASK